MRGRQSADIAAQLSDVPARGLAARIGGASREDRQARKLDLLLDIAKELSQQTEVDRLLDRVVGLTFQVMSVDRVAILTSERPAASWCRGCGAAGWTAPAGSWRVPRSIARKAIEERVAVLIENAAADRRFEGTRCPPALQSALCAPLLGKQGTVLGIIYLDNLGAAHSFSEEDLEFLTAFSGMAAVAIENSQLDRAGAARGGGALELPALLRARTSPRQIAGQEGDDPARRREAAGGHPLLRHPRLHLALRDDEPGRDRDACSPSTSPRWWRSSSSTAARSTSSSATP